MISIRRLIGGLSFLCILIGGLLVCFVPGGFLNPHYDFRGRAEFNVNGPLHITGFILGIVGGVGFVILFSLKRPDKNQPSTPNSP